MRNNSFIKGYNLGMLAGYSIVAIIACAIHMPLWVPVMLITAGVVGYAMSSYIVSKK